MRLDATPEPALRRLMGAIFLAALKSAREGDEGARSFVLTYSLYHEVFDVSVAKIEAYLATGKSQATTPLKYCCNCRKFFPRTLKYFARANKKDGFLPWCRACQSLRVRKNVWTRRGRKHT